MPLDFMVDGQHSGLEFAHCIFKMISSVNGFFISVLFHI